MTYVPYRDFTPALSDVDEGRIDVASTALHSCYRMSRQATDIMSEIAEAEQRGAQAPASRLAILWISTAPNEACNKARLAGEIACDGGLHDAFNCLGAASGSERHGAILVLQQVAGAMHALGTI